MSNLTNQQVRTIKDKIVQEQLNDRQKLRLQLLTKECFPNIKKFTMSKHLNVIIITKNNNKILYGHWFYFAFKKLLPKIAGLDNTKVLKRIQSHNIIDVLYNFKNNGE